MRQTVGKNDCYRAYLAQAVCGWSHWKNGKPLLWPLLRDRPLYHRKVKLI